MSIAAAYIERKREYLKLLEIDFRLLIDYGDLSEDELTLIERNLDDFKRELSEFERDFVC